MYPHEASSHGYHQIEETWRTLIKSSTRLRQACIVTPEAQSLDMFCGYCPNSVPAYPDHVNFKLSPVPKTSEHLRKGRIQMAVTFKYEKLDSYPVVQDEA